MNLIGFEYDRDVQRGLEKIAGKQFSDILDSEGNQYIDLVMEGGGMLGIALVGYTWALEQAGIRFLGVGGTSAGSINAILLAALLPDSSNKKSVKLSEILSSMNFMDFVDGGASAKGLVRSISKNAGKLVLTLRGLPLMDNVVRKLGINPGNAFTKWISTILAENGVRTLADLMGRLDGMSTGLRLRDGVSHANSQMPGGRMALIGADVSTETKVTFPDMADMYFTFPYKVNPALFVRASMAIPFFFEPLIIDNLPGGMNAIARWQDVGFNPFKEKGLPKKAVFVDGGVLSNFPIDVFHQKGAIPRMPTFGVKLQYDNRAKKIKSPFSMAGAIFNSARHCLDYDFIRRNPDYKRLVQWIPCQGHNWLNFAMSEEEQKSLFKEGALKALAFLDTFEWGEYKDLRKKMI